MSIPTCWSGKAEKAVGPSTRRRHARAGFVRSGRDRFTHRPPGLLSTSLGGLQLGIYQNNERTPDMARRSKPGLDFVISGHCTISMKAQVWRTPIDAGVDHLAALAAPQKTAACARIALPIFQVAAVRP
jgi:hypothetical protein